MSKKIKIVITVMVALLALVLAIIYSIPSFIDKEAIRTQLISSFKALTGLDLEIEGDVVVERFPTPHVVVNSMYVHNAQGGIEPFLLTIKLVEIWPDYKGMLGKKTGGLGSIIFSDVDLELERLKTNQMNWMDSSVQTSEPEGASGLTGHDALNGARIIINNGYIRYTDENNSQMSEYKDIHVELLNGGEHSESSIALSVRYNDKLLDLKGRVGSLKQALTVGEVPANLSIISGKSQLIYEGNAGFRNNVPVINGNVKFSTDDAVSWMSTLSGSAADSAQEYTTASFKPLPLQLSSEISSDNGKIILPNLNVGGDVVKGNLKVVLTPPYGFNITGTLDKVDLETIYASKLFATKFLADPLSAARNQVTTFQLTPKSFINQLNLSCDVKINDIIYNEQHVKDGHAVFDMESDEMTISQATATLPGDTRLVFSGLGKEGYQGFTLEGQLDLSGGDFTQAVKVIKANGVSLPPEDFKRFRMRANAIISPQEMRFSELTARIENMAFVGGFIAKFGDRIKLEAALRVGGLNLDHFIQVWGIEQWRTSLNDSTPGEKYDSYIARWLRRLDYDAAMNISLEQYVLLGRPRDRAEFKLEATNGKVSFNDIKTQYNGSNMNGYFMLDVRNTLPRIDIKFAFDTFDPNVFFSADGATPAASPAAVAATAPAAPLAAQGNLSGQAAMPSGEPPSPSIPLPAESAKPVPNAIASLAPQWSHQQFDFHWLELLTGTFRFTFDHFTYGRVRAESLNILGGVDEHVLTIDSFSGHILDAQVAGKVNVVGGKIPSINIGANISALDTEQVIPFFPILKGVTGKYNLSFKLNTSGIDMYSWISTLQGTIGLGGDNLNIHGFNLPGVIRSVSYVRTVADILNVVRRAFPGGDTMFNNIEGQWSIAGGVVKTSNSRLTNDMATGLLVSQIDLMNWQTQSSITLSLKALDQIHPPEMVITFSGSLDNPDISLDTRSLEQYVTNKTSEKMLEQYGTQQ